MAAREIGPAARRALVVGLVVTGVTLAGWVALRSGGVDGGGPAAATASSVPSPAAAAVHPASEAVVPASDAEWRAVMEELYTRRAEAFATASPGLLSGVYVSGSPLLAADTDLARALADAGEVLRGFDPVVQQVTVAEQDGDRVQLELVDSWAGYDVVPAARPGAQAVRTGTARPAAAVRMVLVRAGDGWLIESAERAV